MALGDKLPVVMGKEKAAANGVATLGADGKLAEEQRPTPTEAGAADLTLSNLSNYQKALAAIGGKPRDNLLDNAYFKGGGSQQGGGQFPINQRGETSWSQGSAFDRWLISKPSGSEATVTLSEDGVSASAPCYFFERLEGKWLAGKQLTLSALLDSGELLFGTVTFNQQNSVATNNGEFSLYMENLSNTSFTVFAIRWITASEKKVVAAKIELGPTQTLAYQDEDGAWQLFETPDYGEELAKCQRYQLNLPYGRTPNFSPIGFGYAITDTQVRILIPNPSTMRTNPSISYLQGDISGITLIGGGLELIPTAVSNITALSYGVSVIFAVSGATPKESYAMRMTRAYMMLDANL